MPVDKCQWLGHSENNRKRKTVLAYLHLHFSNFFYLYIMDKVRIIAYYCFFKQISS